MSKFLNLAAMLLLTVLCANCSSDVKAPTAADEAAVRTFWNNVMEDATAGNDEKMWAAYAENAAEIGPDGSLTTGKKAMRDGWEAFMKMVDAKPTFKGNILGIRFLSADVAIVTFNSEADIKMGGQQLGGKTTGLAVLHKTGGKWLIEIDSITPILPPPPMPGEAKK